jgi:hypothetical protein
MPIDPSKVVVDKPAIDPAKVIIASNPAAVSPQQLPDTAHLWRAPVEEADILSQITGRPVSVATSKLEATPGERMRGGQEAAAAMAPIAGDIGLTMAAPQFKGAQLGVRAINAIIRGIAAFTGGTGGELAGQQILGEEADLGKAAQQGGIGAAVETGLPAVGFVARKAAKPVLELGANMTVSGKAILNRARDKIIQDTTERSMAFINDLKVPGSKSESGLQIGAALADKQDFKKVYAGYNKLVDSAAGEGNEIILDGFSQKIGDMVQEQMTRQGDQNWGTALGAVLKDLNIDAKSKRILNDMYKQSGYLNKEDVKYVLAKINKGWKADTATTKKLKEDLKATLLDDIGINSMTGAEAAEAKRTADEIFKQTKQWFEQNPAAQSVIQKMRSRGGTYFEAFPEKALDNIFAADPEQLVRIKAEVVKAPGGTEAWAGAEYQFLKDMFEGAIKKDEATGQTQLLPYALHQNIMDNADKIKKLMPDLWPKLKAEADHYLEVAPEFKKRATAGALGGSERAVGAVGATAAMGPWGIPVAEGFGAISAYALMSKNSQKGVQRLLQVAPEAGAVLKPVLKSTMHLKASHGDTNP